MSSRRDALKALADARPARLDPDPGSRPDPYGIVAHPQPTIASARTGGRRARRLILAGALPAVAAAVVGAVFLGAGGAGPAGTLGAGSPASDPAATTAPAPRTARELLLVAAEQSAADPTGGGRYWVLDQVHGSLRQVGPKSRPYNIIERRGLRSWEAMTAAGRSVGFFRDLGAEPFTAEDRAAWQADGSPTQWTLPAPEGVPGAEPIIISGRPRPETVERGAARPMPPGVKDGNAPYYLAGGSILRAELAAIPTDPTALKAWLLKRLKASEVQEATGYSLFWSAKTLVFDLPVSPRVRAAAYRMLADVPGVTSLGTVTDQRGRAGMAVGFARKGDGGHWSQTRLIIDPRTGQALANESWDLGSGHAPRATGTLQSFTLQVSAGFTDEDPPTGQK
ncbi:CU044_5270 family protein [Rhizomonospora bruguierae]|uniref:CU044_5270 family protein n=1 Tax=Rhizomonospora bruguierae TaxID=1581705 RepID=UPI001BCB7CB0|nr:CU044_5270 family protein [Micromonospora sp. NBRC 107566]